MMARGNRFNQRPDTLMQDHHRQIDETPLRRTAGPYICAISGRYPRDRHHFEVTRMEHCLVARYGKEGGGYSRARRDNTDERRSHVGAYAQYGFGISSI